MICLQLRQKHTACTVNLHKLNCIQEGSGERNVSLDIAAALAATPLKEHSLRGR